MTDFKERCRPFCPPLPSVSSPKNAQPLIWLKVIIRTLSCLLCYKMFSVKIIKNLRKDGKHLKNNRNYSYRYIKDIEKGKNKK